MNGGTIIIRDYKDRANAEPGELLLNFEVGDTYGFVYWCDNDGNIVPIDTTSRHDLIDYIRINLQVSPTEPTEKDLSTTWYDSRPNADAVWDDLLNTGTMATIKFYDGTKFNTILPRTIAEAILFDHPSYGKITLREYVDLFEELLDFKGGKVPSHIELMANFRTSMTLYKADGTHRNPSGYADGKYFTNGLVDYGNTRFAKNNMLGVNLGTASINGHSATLYYEGGFISRDRTFLFDITVKQNAHVIEASDTFIVELDLDGHTGSTVNVVGGVSFNASGVVTGSYAFNRDTGAIYKIVVHGATHDTTSGHLQLGGKTTANNCETLRSFVSTTMGGLTQQTLANLVLSQYTLPQLPQVGQVPNTIASYDSTNHIPEVWMKDTDLGDKTWVSDTVDEKILNYIYDISGDTYPSAGNVYMKIASGNSDVVGKALFSAIYTRSDYSGDNTSSYIINISLRGTVSSSILRGTIHNVTSQSTSEISVFAIQNTSGGVSSYYDIYILHKNGRYMTTGSLLYLSSTDGIDRVVKPTTTIVDPGYSNNSGEITSVKTSKTEVGLGNVENYGISSSITSTSTTTYANSAAVKHANDNANTKLPLAGGTLTGAIMMSGSNSIQFNDRSSTIYKQSNSRLIIGNNGHYIAMDNNGGISHSVIGGFYGTNRRPSATDVGALPTTGGTMTGSLSAPDIVLHQNISEAAALTLNYNTYISFGNTLTGHIVFLGEHSSSGDLRIRSKQGVNGTLTDRINFTPTGRIECMTSNVHANAYSSGWGDIGSVHDIGSFVGVMGDAGQNASWLLTGRQNGSHKCGLQFHNSLSIMRIYLHTSTFFHLSDTEIYNPTLRNIKTDQSTLIFNKPLYVNSDKVMLHSESEQNIKTAKQELITNLDQSHGAKRYIKVGYVQPGGGSSSNMSFIISGSYFSDTSGGLIHVCSISGRASSGHLTGFLKRVGTTSSDHAPSEDITMFGVSSGTGIDVWIVVNEWISAISILPLSIGNSATYYSNPDDTTVDPGFNSALGVISSTLLTNDDVGLGNVENYGISDSITLDSSSSYASSKAVKHANDNANTKLPLAGGTLTGNLTIDKSSSQSKIWIKSNAILGQGPSIEFDSKDSQSVLIRQNSYDSERAPFGLIIEKGANNSSNSLAYLEVAGEIYAGGGHQVYHAGHKPSKSDVGLSHVANVAALPLTGGTMTGNLTIDTSGSTAQISMVTSSNSRAVIAVQNGDSNGNLMYIQSGGGMVLGAGEFPAAMANLITSKGTEELHLGSDNNTYIHTNAQSIGARKTYTFSMSGDFTTPRYIHASRVYNAVYNDYAELFETPQKETGMKFEPGDIVMIDVDAENEEYIICNEECSPLAIGVVSDEYAHLIGGRKPSENSNDTIEEENERDHEPIGLAGRLRVKITGPIKKGDRVVSSSIPGVGRAAKDTDGYRAEIGTSLENKTTDNVDRVRMLIGR